MDGNGSPRSKIGLRSTQDHFVLEIAPRGLHWAAVGQLAGGLLWLAICAQWTGRHHAAGGAGAAVSVPFWLFGLAVVFRAVYGMVNHQRVDLRADAGWVRVWPVGWKKPLRPGTLTVRFDQVTRGEADGRGGVEVPVLVLDDGQRTFRLMEGFTDEERRRVRTELNTWLARRPGSRNT